MKHKIEHIQWQEVVWQRPYKLETVWETLTHLAALTPRGAVVWEARGCDGHITPSATRRGTPSPSLRRLTAWSCGPSPPWTGRRTASN